MPKWVRIPFLGVPSTRPDWLKSLAFHCYWSCFLYYLLAKQKTEDTPGVGATSSSYFNKWSDALWLGSHGGSPERMIHSFPHMWKSRWS